MYPVDLFLFSKTKPLLNNEFISYYKKITKSNQEINIRELERENLYQLIDILKSNGCNLKNLNGFYYSFTIEQIGKEFDLLKFYKEFILNIEIKSEFTSYDKILKQLQLNIHYLKAINVNICCYTFIAKTKKLYKLVNNKLVLVDFNDLIATICLSNECFINNINDLFNPSNYLVSPFNNVDKFVNDEYFLTEQQDYIKKEIMNLVDNDRFLFYKISGNAGTGKTLLIYDIAKEFAKNDKVCIIHSGTLNNGQQILSNRLENIDIISAKTFKNYDISSYKIIIVDESQRIYISEFQNLVDYAKLNHKYVVFSIGLDQIMEYSEIRANINSKIDSLENLKKYELSKKIRTNRNIASYIKNIVNLNEKDKNANYDCIDIYYTQTKEDAKQLLDYLYKYNYNYISFTPSLFNSHEIDSFISTYNTHNVIGQEFDNVVMIMGSDFEYLNNRLNSKTHPNPNFIFSKLFYQGITRARIKLAIIVLRKPSLYKQLVQIKINKGDQL